MAGNGNERKHPEVPDLDISRSNPTKVTLDRIGGKWKTAILCLLAEKGPRRNGQLMRELAPITQKVLTQQLRELERDGLVARKVYPEIPPKVVYELTDSGKSLRMVLDPLCEWGKRFAAAPAVNAGEPRKP
jgi:DNA-binding HxlR family transcriptional regulator